MALVNTMINMETYPECRVDGCRHTDSHVTRDHVCRKCGESGHGVLECSNDNKKLNLRNFRHERLPQSHWCTYPNCSTKEYHKLESHHCENCGLRTSNSNHYCPVKNFNVENFTNMVDINSNLLITSINFDTFLQDKNNIYFRIPFKDYFNKNVYIRKCDNDIMSLVVRFNNDWTFLCPSDESILKRFTKNNTLQDTTGEFVTFPIDSILTNIQTIMDSTDNSSDSDDEMPELMDDFIFQDDGNNPNDVLTTTKKCPLCRMINTKDECFEIKGLSEECKICMNTNVEILYSKCKHACVCKNCFELL